MSPRDGISREIARSSVVLPAPLPPTIATISAWRTVRLMLRSTCISP
jgi:hypothetical protein